MLETDLFNQPNIGKDTATKLMMVGINNYAELRAAGAERAFLLLQSLDPGVCIHLLQALEGAIEGIPKSQLSADKKQELREFHRLANRK